MRFLDGLDSDLKQSLLAQLRNLWTHSSTAIEGNVLTLSDVAFVIEEGLTVSGKPLKDHEEVIGHARGIEFIYELLKPERAITTEDLFSLHKIIQTEKIADIYHPVGDWKSEPNGTYAVTPEGKQVFINYAKPDDVPPLMETCLNQLNAQLSTATTEKEVLDAYVGLHVSFVRIHPFCDGNGRVARLIANLPVLKAGFPPITIPQTKRKEYIEYLAHYELAVGQIDATQSLLPQEERLAAFHDFIQECWQASLYLVAAAHEEQEKRKA